MCELSTRGDSELNVKYRGTLAKTCVQKGVDRGWLSIEMAAVLLIVIIAVAAVAGMIAGNYARNDVSTEISNIQSIMANTRGLLKTQSGYNFTNAAKMTGTLVQFKGVPTTMTINGTEASGTATLWNTWGGAVTLTPEKVGTATTNNGFILTYNAVPQEACGVLAVRLSKSGLVSEVRLNGTTNAGEVTATLAGTQCKADTGSTGTNVMIFKSNV